MSLTPYQRGGTWWVKGRVDYNGRAIGNYIRTSTGATTEAGARDWIAETEDRARRIYLVGEQHALSFADASMLYTPTPTMAQYLAPIVEAIGHMLVKDVTPKVIRDLGPTLYPDNATDTWRRWVVTPARAVINNAHDLGLCPPIKIKGYDEKTRVTQDKRRGKLSRIEREPGSWEWLLQFRAHANRRHAALAHFMFVTGARISQACEMHPRHLDLNNAKATIPGAKGHADRVVSLSPELVEELRALPPLYPRGYERKPKNLRVFGWSDRSGPRSGWNTAIKRAGITRIMPHAAGRHGFAQEMNVRQPVDEKAAGKFGGWRDTALMRRTYTHAEDSDGKVLEAFRTGRVQAEKNTGLKLAKE